MVSDEVRRYREDYLQSNGWVIDYVREAGGKVFKKHNGGRDCFQYDTIMYEVIRYNYYSFFPYGGRNFSKRAVEELNRVWDWRPSIPIEKLSSEYFKVINLD